MQLSQYYRSYELPWELDTEDGQRLRRVTTAGMALLLLFGAVLPFIHLPSVTEAPTPVPERLARLMVQEKPKPPPPVIPQVKPKPEAKPVPVPKPIDKTEEARKKAERQMSKIKDELADLRRDVDLTKLDQSKNLQQAVGQDNHAERSLITSNAGVGSGGIVTTAMASRGFGRGAGAVGDYQAGTVNSRIAQSGHEAVSRSGSGKASRSEEEIAQVFDRNKGAIYALYGRALRSQPDLQGKLVLEFTIAPSGEVTECHVVSSELHDPELERMIVARVKLFQFQARDVAPITTTKPIEFVPAG
jgi:periplasmic protein TonB